MSDYSIRNAEQKDIPFLASAIIAAEKGRSDKLSYSTLFNLSQSRVKELVINMLEEEIDGCELSVSSFLIVEYDGVPVATSAGWIEGFGDNMPSQILKSNLIFNTFGKESIEFFKTKAHIVRDILIDRDPLTLQLEYLYIADEHIGKGLDAMLINKSIENSLQIYPALQKIQGQLFKNSIFAIIALRKKGFVIAKTCKATNKEILDYIPFDEKLMMEKQINI
jgi:hypothetical protein